MLDMYLYTSETVTTEGAANFTGANTAKDYSGEGWS